MRAPLSRLRRRPPKGTHPVAHIPLHNQMLAWAMKKNVELVQRPDNRIDWRLIKVN